MFYFFTQPPLVTRIYPLWDSLSYQVLSPVKLSKEIFPTTIAYFTLGKQASVTRTSLEPPSQPGHTAPVLSTIGQEWPFYLEP